MQTHTRDSVPWRLRSGPPLASGALASEQIDNLSQQHGLEQSAVAELSRTLSSALWEDLRVKQLELMPLQRKKGATEVRAAIKLLQSVEADLAQIEEIVGQLRFKNPFSHTGMPNPSKHHLEQFSGGREAIIGFREYLETMARNGRVAFTGHPDKRKISDLRRNMVCFAIFNLWLERGRSLTYTSDFDTSVRGGRLIEFVNAVVECITDPPSRLDDDAIRREIKQFKSGILPD